MAEASSTFILRLWINDEPHRDQPPHGRGKIEHLQSGERIYFDQLESALAFIRQHFGAYDSLQAVDSAHSRHNQESQDRRTSMKGDRT